MRSIKRASSTSRSIVHDSIAIIYCKHKFHSPSMKHINTFLVGTLVVACAILGHCGCFDLLMNSCWGTREVWNTCLRKWKAFALIERWTDGICGERLPDLMLGERKGMQDLVRLLNNSSRQFCARSIYSAMTTFYVDEEYRIGLKVTVDTSTSSRWKITERKMKGKWARK